MSKKQEIIEQLEKEKVAKLDMRNRALKDYEIYYSEFEEIKEKDNSLMENLKKKEEDEKKATNCYETLKGANSYKEEEFTRLLEEQKDLANEIKERKEGKSIYSRGECGKKEEGEENKEIEKGKDEKIEDGYIKTCKFC